MTHPDPQPYYAAIDATWPPASQQRLGPWTIREGQGGGSRVSAATAHGTTTSDDIAAAEGAMRDLGQTPLFMIRAADDTLDETLGTRGYAIKDPVALYAAPTTTLTKEPMRPVTTFRHWPPLAAAREIWSEAGIGPARLAVMDRCKGPKTALLGRTGDSPAGVCFVAKTGPLAVLHALEIRPMHRRKSLGRHMVIAAAHWAQEQGASELSLLVTTDNEPANALYRALEMQIVARYHYRKAAT